MPALAAIAGGDTEFGCRQCIFADLFMADIFLAACVLLPTSSSSLPTVYCCRPLRLHCRQCIVADLVIASLCIVADLFVFIADCVLLPTSSFTHVLVTVRMYGVRNHTKTCYQTHKHVAMIKSHTCNTSFYQNVNYVEGCSFLRVRCQYLLMPPRSVLKPLMTSPRYAKKALGAPKRSPKSPRKPLALPSASRK